RAVTACAPAKPPPRMITCGQLAPSLAGTVGRRLRNGITMAGSFGENGRRCAGVAGPGARRRVGEGSGAAGRLGCRAQPVLRRWPSDRIVPAATATRTADVGSMVQRTCSRGTGGKGSSPTAPGPLVSDSGRGRLGRGRLGRGRLGCR